jgi:hypothetical protein
MPPASVRFVRSAWSWFLLGLGLGAVLVGAKVGWLPPQWLGLRPAHVHVLTLGWAVQWVFGIAFWIYPAFGSERTGPGPTRAMASCWALLNAGVLVRACGEAAYDCGIARDAGAWGLVAGSAAELVAAVLFVAIIRRRVRPAGWIRRALGGAAAEPPVT